jgi:signal peptidase I
MTSSDLTSRSTITLLAAFGIVAGLFAYSFRLVRVEGASMEPTYHHGQWLLVRRFNWPAQPLAHDEVVVFRLGADVLIKRVAALPGERPPLDDLRLIRLLHPRVQRWYGGDNVQTASLFAPVPESSVYVLGDNAERSDDSRRFGAIPVDAIIGRVVQWDPAEPPERDQIGYTRPRQARLLARAETAHQATLAPAGVAHP